MFLFCAANGARISSHSYGGPQGSYAMKELIEQVVADGHLMFSAAGNEQANNGGMEGSDAYPRLPV